MGVGLLHEGTYGKGRIIRSGNYSQLHPVQSKHAAGVSMYLVPLHVPISVSASSDLIDLALKLDGFQVGDHELDAQYWGRSEEMTMDRPAAKVN